MTWKLDCGSYQLFVIEDGYYWRNPKTYHREANDDDWRLYPRNDLGQVRLNIGCFLITDGERTVMVDSGMGKPPSNTPGGFVSGLMPAVVDSLGVSRDSVDTVIYSHMHYDHIGGSRDGRGTPIFPNARHVFHQREWDHWSTLDSDPAKAARDVVRPLLDADRVQFIDRDTEVVPGVTAVESFGHTPGHLMVSIISDRTRTLIGGDISNHPFQVEHPHWSLPVDDDPVAAGHRRDRVFEEIKDTGVVFLAGHYPMPGVGEVVTDDGTRVFMPALPERG
jgi:glyoxylase-like metal-dependent hydrolase (beta-lactamase superfamily II)